MDRAAPRALPVAAMAADESPQSGASGTPHRINSLARLTKSSASASHSMLYQLQRLLGSQATPRVRATPRA